MRMLLIYCLFTSLNCSAQMLRVAFGSCSNQKDSLSIFSTIVEHDPDYFIFLGDNVYLDSDNKDTICLKYDSLANNINFQNLSKHCPIWATWDDHDYGSNDAGKELQQKEQSKQLFLDFFGAPPTSCRYFRKGVYGSKILTVEGHRFQFILLDTRTFRDSLCAFNETPYPANYFSYTPDYSPCLDSTKTLLGNEQWIWLERQFMIPADVRIVCSSIQFSHSFNGCESWNNLPHEKQRMIELINCTSANGIVFISGDLHMGEISKQTSAVPYPIYDITSSGLSSKWHSPLNNDNRISEIVYDNNFGLLEIQKINNEIVLYFQLLNNFNQSCASIEIPLSSLQIQKSIHTNSE